MRRNAALLSIIIASLALAACADATGPNTTPKKECGIVVGTGICTPK